MGYSSSFHEKNIKDVRNYFLEYLGHSGEAASLPYDLINDIRVFDKKPLSKNNGTMGAKGSKSE